MRGVENRANSWSIIPVNVTERCVWFSCDGRQTHPRWTVRMCRWIPEEVLRTFSQFFHKHLNITFMEFWKRRSTQSHHESADSWFVSLYTQHGVSQTGWYGRWYPCILCHHFYLWFRYFRLIKLMKVNSCLLVSANSMHAGVCFHWSFKNWIKLRPLPGI